MKKNLTELVFILDRSGSMYNLVSDTIGGYNSMIERQKKEPGDAYVTTVLFDDNYTLKSAWDFITSHGIGKDCAIALQPFCGEYLPNTHAKEFILFGNCSDFANTTNAPCVLIKPSTYFVPQGKNISAIYLPKWDKAYERLEDYRTKIKGIDGEIVADVAPALRGWEGLASKIYFEALNLFLPEMYRFEGRRQHPATDITNAFLNYGYGVLYGKIEGALIKAGIDPYVGVMHRDDYNRPVLVYDIIELYRVWVDYVVCSLLMQQVVTDEYYSVKEDGSYWLEALGRRVLIQSLNDYLDEVVAIKGVSKSRLNQISLYAQNLAQQWKKYI